MRPQLFAVIVSVVTLICPVTSADQTLYNHYTATYGLQCYDTCAKHGNNYYWCHTTKGWDYCSPAENTDTYGNTCRKDHPCGKYGEDYSWCKNDWWGNYGKCGQVEPKSTIYTTKYLSVCIDDCTYDANSEYSWCHTEKGTDYCSVTHDATYKNEPCKSDHPCDTHGYGYNWCKTESDWDYCGAIKPDKCTFFGTRRRKRQPGSSSSNNNNQIGFCTRVDRGNNVVTTFSAIQDTTAIAEVTNRDRRLEISGLIARWNNGYLSGNQARSNLITSEHYRIDLQGLVNINNQRYYNLQIQENIPRKKGESTTVSQILVPQHDLNLIPERYIRSAFTLSRNNQSKVTLTVNQQSQNS